MSKEPNFWAELQQLRDYLSSKENEDAKRPNLYPLFKRLYKEKTKIESAAQGADLYVDGLLIVEAKTDHSQWLEGFYQALHYKKKFGLGYSTIIVIAHNFIAIWKLHKLPEEVTKLAHQADPLKAPNVIGKENARKTAKSVKLEIRNSAFYWLDPVMLDGDPFAGARNLTTESFEILKILRNIESDRMQVNTHNFIHTIERMKPYFEHPIDAVHAFYTIIAYWDITSKLSSNNTGNEVRVIGFNGNKFSDPILIHPHNNNDFKQFIESQYIFTNEGSGLTVDYYFSRFDEVLAKIDPEYVKQHGIFFTDGNLSKFALWYAKHHFPGNINEDYIVFDPAGGSGNLVSSWRGRIKHKIVSELQPDLLRTIERRMKVDPYHQDTGFTIIPKTSDNRGLNFLDKSGVEYYQEIERELALKHVALDKPIAFLLNPPYKNTDENVKAREDTDAHYDIHPSILELTGEDAGKERYLAFLGQILNICKEQNERNPALLPLVMIFTPTSWLLPRPTYIPFRAIWDQYFDYHSGFLVTGNEFFKLDGRWPLAFTIWQYKANAPILGAHNEIKILDLTLLKHIDLNINWNFNDEKLEQQLESIIKPHKEILLNNDKGDIRELLPNILVEDKEKRQTRYDFSTAKKEKDEGHIISGFPIRDVERHETLKRKCGSSFGEFIGFMDDLTPVRVHDDSLHRVSKKCIWFRLDNTFKDINKTKSFNGPTDNRSYCAYDLNSSKATFTWFAITKAINGKYPVWANQYDIWPPSITDGKRDLWYINCFAFVLSENRCVVTKFEKDNPVQGAPEIFVDNPMCPTNANSFWSTTLQPYIDSVNGESNAKYLITAVKDLYRLWNRKYAQGQYLYNVGLQNEPYFKYFNYADFLTPHSGLVQIEKYAAIHALEDLIEQFDIIKALTKKVREDLYKMLVNDFKYFE